MIHIVPILRDNYCYILEGEDKSCIIVDPGEFKKVEFYIDQHGLLPKMILNTHHHADHVAGNAELKRRFGLRIGGPKKEERKITEMDDGYVEGDEIECSGIKLKVMETPGHTHGHIVFYWAEKNALICGDTLFSMGCGRIFEGTPEDMFSSLQKIKQMPPDTEIYCGHEYTESNGAFALDVDPDNNAVKKRMQEVRKLRGNNLPTVPVKLRSEMETNPFLRAVSPKEFAGLRARKDQF